MVKEIEHKGQKIQYKLVRRKGAKNITLSIHDSGLAVVSRPWWVREQLAYNFLQEKIDWVYGKIQKFQLLDTNLTTYNHDHYLQYREQARVLVHAKLEQFNAHYNFIYHRVSIRPQKTRWGSCSSRGNLNFNYKILFLDEELQDYLIVHELAHLQEMNHGPKFWALVSETIPDAKQKAKKLRVLTR